MYRARSKTVGAILAIGFTFLAMSMILPDTAGAQGLPVVNCYDAERELVQKKLRSDCRGRIVSDSEAAEIRDERARRKLRQLGGMREFRPRPAPAYSGSSIGSGFYLTPAGHVLTSDHVVADCEMIVVEGPGQSPAAARLMARDPRLDLALLSTQAQPPGHAIFRVEPLRADEVVLTVGYPVRTLTPLQPIATQGAFLSRRRLGDSADLLLVRADLHPGNSGGPLIDRSGNVVGIVAAQIDTPKVYRETGTLIKDVGLAISSESIISFLERAGVKPARNRQSVPHTEADLYELARQFVARITCRR